MREIEIELNVPPEQRWRGRIPDAPAVRDLLQFYVKDLGGMDSFAPVVAAYCDRFVEREYLAEMEGIAEELHVDAAVVRVGNLYYDAIKYVIGCTAIGVPTEAGPMLARNLDWWTERGALADMTAAVKYMRGGRLAYVVAGWPGFAACLSGMRPGAFALALNAVSSTEPAGIAEPMSFLTRRVLDQESSFEAAVERLRSTPVVSDSILTVVGTSEGEAVVVERTPTRGVVRSPSDYGVVVATNEYRTELAHDPAKRSWLSDSAGGRYERALALIAQKLPRVTPAQALEVLSDPGVRLSCTVQQMTFIPRSGAWDIRPAY